MTMTAAAVMGLASCSNENDPTGDPGATPQGVPTGMRLVLDMGGNSMTRANNEFQDGNATDAERTIKDLTVFIYGDNGVYQSYKTIDFAQLVDGKEENTYSTGLIETTTGTKTIFVGANMDKAMINAVIAKSTDGLKNTGFNKELSTITDQTGFVMFSRKGVTQKLLEMIPDPNDPVNNDPTLPTENTIEISIERLAAKIAVGMTKDLDKDTQLGAAGSITDLGFFVDNINKMYYLADDDDDHNDANMYVKDYKEADFEFVPDFSADTYKSIKAGDPYVAANGGSWGIDYASENLTTDKIIKGVTRIVVRGVFTPKQSYQVTGTGKPGTGDDPADPDYEAPDPYVFTLTDDALTPGATYIQLEFPEAGGFAFFPGATTDPQLKAFIAEKKGNNMTADQVKDEMLAEYKKTYTSGLNYWWVTVKDNQGDMKRNDYYKVDITSIYAPGRPDGEFTDKDENKEIGKDTNIDVMITVMPWNLVEFGADLKP